MTKRWSWLVLGLKRPRGLLSMRHYVALKKFKAIQQQLLRNMDVG